MLASSERDMPQAARARLVSLRGSILTAPSPMVTLTSSGSASCKVPFGPFTLMFCPLTFAVTPDGIATAFFPMRDIALRTFQLEHRAQDLAADVLVACFVIRHHPLGGRQDRDPEPVVDARQRPHRGIDAPTGLRHPGDLADHRRAVEIFELDIELAAAVLVLERRVAADIAFVLQHVENAGAQTRAGGRYARLDARGHIAERIVQSHLPGLLTSSTSRGQGSYPWRRDRAAQCGSS